MQRLQDIERTQPNLSDSAIPPAAGAEPPPSNTPSHTVRQPSAEVMPPSEKAAPIRSKRRPLLIGGFSLLAVGAMVAVVLNLPRRQSPVEPPIEESKRPTAENKPPPEVKPPLPPTFANPLGMKFVLAPKGTGWLGGSNGKPGDEKVEIAQDFYLGTHEVTQEEWEKVMGSNPSQFSRSGEKRNSVTQVSDAECRGSLSRMSPGPRPQDFVARLNEPYPTPGWEYRLPTCAEWEYACRGGAHPNRDDYGFTYYFDRPTNEVAPSQANYHNVHNRTCKVGSYVRPNPLGLYDMHGNVEEWCTDEGLCFDRKTVGRVHMGGDWNDTAWYVLAGKVEATRADFKLNSLGVRVARVPTVPSADRVQRSSLRSSNGCSRKRRSCKGWGLIAADAPNG